ncbi:MAG: VapC toxin family PIN domain ribonuclease [Zetaproteobacteria bacterium CG12_big_fil_rev_8_21_14_0_65_54_13]|nr:MAG: VapC toxin family PIN domain ribonuclease [Zetaproteobacteria bacterium CG23_combo_of_CG06-09_8_20_14_all_54_7]PIW49578.1 MAG: VapC toxin family PIN domain ribonuclease [Zetaproteobacteria bacterium CG12_big_fil_rev_8_21_14_0_65_54_13]PIX53357.1 MAG: VapC toxin family PIN domain ribonuclease [Zetaproteobacteria bacterium CG_4_10_14_3_um_filter_54_28]PJA27045.1 MAG: VapC toxin family PIN domain ribonuclease [Zetaproteobacteria bacterium CG_4_9_14_3_um_filter_54_145]
MSSVLIDTDVIIWHMRGHEKARKIIYELEKPAVSIITQMELVQGLRSKQEQVALHRFIEQLSFAVLPVSEVISQRALFLMEEWRLSHQMLMADALIAATAIEYGLTLLSGNEKHYRFLTMLRLKKFRP